MPDRNLVSLCAILPYSDKRKQLLKMTFLVNEQNVSVMYIDINAISLCLDLNIFRQDELFCPKLGLEVKHANTPVTLEAEWARMPSEWKFFLHFWIFEMHSKNSDCILSAFQVFGPILVAGPNVFVMLKTFEVHSKLKNIERHSNCTLIAF